MKILLKGYYGYGNLGDDILMLVSYNILKEIYPDSEILIFSNNSINNNNSKTNINYNNYITTILDHDLSIIDWTYKGHFDLIFHGGGGTYFDHNMGNLRLVNSLIRLLPLKWVTIINQIIRKIAGKKPNITYTKRIGAGIGIGKFTKNSNILFERLSELGSFNKLIVRDLQSMKFLDDSKMDKSIFFRNTDLAFLNSWNEFTKKQTGKIQTIGIVVKDNLDEDLNQSLITFARFLIKKNLQVTFFSFDANYDINCKNKFESFNFSQYQPSQLEPYLKSLRSTDLLITSRAHGAILGACLGVPSIVLNTELKLGEVANMLKKSCVKMDKWSLSEFQRVFTSISHNYESILKTMELEVKELQQKASELKNLIE